MDDFDKAAREAELHGEQPVRSEFETYYRPENEGMFGEPTEFTAVEVEFVCGTPQRCYCGFYEEPEPDARKVETCLQCDQGAMF